MKHLVTHLIRADYFNSKEGTDKLYFWLRILVLLGFSKKAGEDVFSHLILKKLLDGFLMVA